MTEQSGLHLLLKQPRALRRVWESLWAPTTCSVSHILSHLRGHFSTDPQPNYSATPLTAIKRRAAGVRGSRMEPGCCHGHCQSADFSRDGEGCEELSLIACCNILRPIAREARRKTITDVVVMQLNSSSEKLAAEKEIARPLFWF